MSFPVGIDLGNYSTVVAVARNRGIDVLVNEVSNRSTPSLVAFGPRSRALGEAAKTQEISNIRNTISSLKRILGRKFSDKEVQNEKRFINAELVDVKGDVGVRVQYQGKKEVFTATQLVGAFLSKIKATAAQEIGSAVKDVSISVPAWYTDAQRRALIDAAHIANLNPVRLITDTSAAALSYGVFKTDLPEDKPRIVAFVDIGHSTYTVTIAAFKKGEMKVLGCASDRNFGGREVDYALAEHFAAEFKEKYKIDVHTNPKAYSRLLTGVEKIKKVLSANLYAPLNIESIMDDKDVSSSLKREELEELIKPHTDRLSVPLDEALKQANLQKEQLDYIEILGGTSRIPVIKDTLQEYFGKQLSATLNQDEAIARGCAFVAATHSPTMRVRPFKYEDITQYSVKYSWDPSADEDAHELEVFPSGNPVPSTKIITLYKKEDFHVVAEYSNPKVLPGGSSQWIGQWTIKGVKPEENGEPSAIKLRLRVDPSGLYNAESAYTVVEQIVEEPIEEEAPAATSEGGEGKAPEGEAEKSSKEAPKTRKVKKLVKKDILTIIHGSTSLDSSIKNELIEKESQMVLEDKHIQDTEERKNALEEYIYDMRGKLDDKYADFASDAEKTKLRKMLDSAEEWLYDEGEDASKAQYIAKYEELNAIGGIIRGRYQSKIEEEKQAALEAERAKQAEIEKQQKEAKANEPEQSQTENNENGNENEDVEMSG